MSTVGTFSIALTLNAARFQSGLSKTEKEWNRFSRSVMRHSKQMPESIQKALPASLAFGKQISKVAAITSAAFAVSAGAAAAWGIKLAESYEQSQMAFTTLLGDAKKAQDFLDELEVRARKTPFGFIGLQQVSKQLLAFGFTARRVNSMLDPIGDAVSALGGGQEMLEDVTKAFGRIQARGKLTMREMISFAGAGIPAWQFRVS